MQELAQLAYKLIGLRLTPAHMAAFELYERELLDWNARFNLTAIRQVETVRVKHFLDSLTCCLALRDSPLERLIDVGTGAGFPGLPLKIVYPNVQLSLVESVGKKADFCRHLVQMLGLEGVEILQERVEEVGRMPAHRQRYDWAVARAVAVMPVLAEYLLPLVRVGGRLLAMKGESGPAEAQEAEHAMRLMGGHLRHIIPVTLPGVVEEHYLVVVDKVAATPDHYPRRVGVPAKKPITAGD